MVFMVCEDGAPATLVLTTEVLPLLLPIELINVVISPPSFVLTSVDDCAKALPNAHAVSAARSVFLFNMFFLFPSRADIIQTPDQKKKECKMKHAPYLVTAAATSSRLTPAVKEYIYNANPRELAQLPKAYYKGLAVQALTFNRPDTVLLAIGAGLMAASVICIPILAAVAIYAFMSYRQKAEILAHDLLNIKYTLRSGARNFDPRANHIGPVGIAQVINAMKNASRDERIHGWGALSPMYSPDLHLKSYSHINDLMRTVDQLNNTVTQVTENMDEFTEALPTIYTIDNNVSALVARQDQRLANAPILPPNYDAALALPLFNERGDPALDNDGQPINPGIVLLEEPQPIVI
jgi:hypothetical protein